MYRTAEFTFTCRGRYTDETNGLEMLVVQPADRYGINGVICVEASSVEASSEEAPDSTGLTLRSELFVYRSQWRVMVVDETLYLFDVNINNGCITVSAGTSAYNRYAVDKILKGEA